MILLWKVLKEKPCIRLAVSISKYLDFRPLFTQVERGAGGEYMKFKEGLQFASLTVILIGVLNKLKALQRLYDMIESLMKLSL